MKPGSVLIVVPDEMFRLSLAFLMESEGYVVRVGDSLPTLADMEDGLADISCALIDHSAMGKETARLDALRGKGVPIVMLASHLDRMPRLDGVQLIEKPAPGAAVVDAVRGSMARSRPSAGLAT